MEITGYAVDIDGNPIKSVKVKLRAKETKTRKKTLSDVKGSFEFTDLEKTKKQLKRKTI